MFCYIQQLILSYYFSLFPVRALYFESYLSERKFVTQSKLGEL